MESYTMLTIKWKVYFMQSFLLIFIKGTNNFEGHWMI